MGGYSIYGKFFESVDHLFCSCPFSTLIWSSMCGYLGISSLLDKLLTLCSKQLNNNFPKDAISTTFMLIVTILWAIWKERNSRIFLNNFSSHSSSTQVALQSFNEWSILCGNKVLRIFFKLQSSIKHSCQSNSTFASIAVCDDLI